MLKLVNHNTIKIIKETKNYQDLTKSSLIAFDEYTKTNSIYKPNFYYIDNESDKISIKNQNDLDLFFEDFNKNKTINSIKKPKLIVDFIKSEQKKLVLRTEFIQKRKEIDYSLKNVNMNINNNNMESYIIV